LATNAVEPGGEQGPVWTFPVYVTLLLAVLFLATSFLSVTDLRAAQAAATARGGGPTRPLTITTVSVVQAGIAGSEVSVAGTAGSLVASFVGSTEWRPDARQCLPDITGIVGGTGTERLIQATVHVEAIAGDPGSGDVYATGLGEYCAQVARRSIDGGATWTAAALPPALSADLAWLRFDPSRPGTLLVLGAGRLFVSTDTGLTWSAESADVQPLGFDAGGVLFGWSPGSLYTSTDEGATWQLAGSGPDIAPSDAGSADGGLLLAEPDGLWWYPEGGTPVPVRSGRVLGMASAGDGVVVAGIDAGGRPWLGAFAAEGGAGPTLRLALVPAGLNVSGVATARVAANDSGALVALGGTTSALLVANFAR
jgi:hypothetical protein